MPDDMRTIAMTTPNPLTDHQPEGHMILTKIIFEYMTWAVVKHMDETDNYPWRVNNPNGVIFHSCLTREEAIDLCIENADNDYHFSHHTKKVYCSVPPH